MQAIMQAIIQANMQTVIEAIMQAIMQAIILAIIGANMMTIMQTIVQANVQPIISAIIQTSKKRADHILDCEIFVYSMVITLLYLGTILLQVKETNILKLWDTTTRSFFNPPS